MKITVVGITGTIGVGKSTIINKLKKENGLSTDNTKVIFILEPTAEWEELGWLEAFYKDPIDNAFSFQMGVFDTYVDQVNEAISTHKAQNTQHLIIVVERTMYCQKLFWCIQRDLGRTKKMEDQVYVRMWQKWKDLIPPVDLIILLKTTKIETTMDRIKKRNRGGESGISLDYQKRLIKKHLEWYTKNKTVDGVKCTHLNVDSEDTNALADKMKAHILNFF